MNSIKFKTIFTLGYYEIELTQNDLIPIIEEINEIKIYPSKYDPANHALAGQIECEYKLKKVIII